MDSVKAQIKTIEKMLLVASRRAPPNFFFYRRGYKIRNFGDELSPVLVAAILCKKYPGRMWDTRSKTNKALAIGSILHFASDCDVIWGSGINGKIPGEEHRFQNLDVRAVRGPLTRNALLEKGINCPNIFGDPALLVPRYLKVGLNRAGARADFVIIPNYNDIPLFSGVENVISPLDPLKKVVRQILGSRKVISSSLHGVVLAEAYGIPAVLLLPEGFSENIFKYQDYYEGTGRKDVEIASTLDEAMNIKVPGISDARFLDRLEAAFPGDFFLR
jgi:pyruvyltransferase